MKAPTLRTETPQSAMQSAELLRSCADEGVAVRFVGGETKAWGLPGSDCAVQLRTSALEGP